MARCPFAVWNPAPASCYTKKRSKKIAVCDHRTVGWIGYLRNFDHLKEKPPRRVSAMFTVAMDGSIQQHVDTDYIAWTQGIGPKYYDYAAARWPLFQQHNPNIDCVGIEHEDGAKPFTADFPMPNVQLAATLKLHAWIFDEVIGEDPVIGENLISHDMLTPQRNQDPGDWVMNAIAEGLMAFPAQQAPDALAEPTGDLQQQIDHLEYRIAALEGVAHGEHSVAVIPGTKRPQ